MGIFDLFPRRQKRLRGEMPDVYQYDIIPEKLRVQIIHIITETFGYDWDWPESYTARRLFRNLHKQLCKEYGIFRLDNNVHDHREDVLRFILNGTDTEQVLGAIQICFIYINNEVRTYGYQSHVVNNQTTPDDAIQELNARFKEHGVGYQFESDKIIRIDSHILHSEAIKPTFYLLGNEKRFQGANEEFLSAHEHYRNGRYSECIVDALKSFESVLKAICHKQKWPYNQKDTVGDLIRKCFENKLIPDYLQTQFGGLRSLLESGLPSMRNREAAHGKGVEDKTITDPMASFALHQAASNILFLVKMEKENFGS